MKAGITILDADGHVLDTEETYQQHLEPPFHERGRSIYPLDGFDRNLGGRLGRRPADAPALLADMDVEGIDTMVLFPTFGLNLGMIREPDYAAALARAYNNWMHDYRQAAPERLKAVAILPLVDPPAAVRELERDDLSETLKRKILGDNALRYYGLAAPVPAR